MGNQIVGFDDIVGLAGNEYGPSEVAGAQRAQVGQPGVLLASNLPKSLVGIPLPPGAMAGGASAEVVIDVQREFRPDRLMLLDVGGTLTTAVQRDLCKLLTFSIGDTNLNASPNPVPALTVFNNAAVGTSIRAPRTTDPSLGINMQLFNDNAAGEDSPSWNYCGGVWGPSARPGSRGGSGSVGAIVGAADGANDPSAESADDAKNLPQSFVGIPYTDDVAPFTRQTINYQVYRDVRPDRLVTGEATWDTWFVRDIRVGTTSLNASTNPVPAICFANLSFGSRLRATVTATPSLGITLDIFSAEATASKFCGAFFGPSRFPTT